MSYNYRYNQGINYTTILKSFLDKGINYLNFKDIDDEKIAHIDELIEDLKKNFKPGYYVGNVKNLFYQEVLTKILHNYKLKDLTFDEKMVLLIRACDPECVLLHEYECANIMSIDTINEAEVNEEKEYLTKVRRTQIGALDTKVRRQVGFFEVPYIKYERDYTNTILFNNEFNTTVDKDYSRSLLDSLSRKDLLKINDEDFKRVNDIAMHYLSSVGNNVSLKVVSNSIIYQNDVLKLKNNTERAIFFILVLDPELITYKLYEEYSNTKQIEPICKDKIGFFDVNLARLEKQYHKLYCPQMFISEWTK